MKKHLFIAGAAVLTLAACSNNETVDTTEVYESSTVVNNSAELNEKSREIARLQRELAEQKAATAAASSAAGSSSDIPPNAQPGECFARVMVPAQYTTETVSVLKSAASEDVRIIPAEYDFVEETVTVKEAETELITIPAVYGYKEEQVLVSPALTELQTIPPVYETQTEQILVSPAETKWKKGKNAIAVGGVAQTRVDAQTGEIMCLVEIPAVYKTVSKRVMVQPASTKEVVVREAQYETVKKRYVQEAARTEERIIPAVTKQVRVKRLVKPASTMTVPIEPVYENVTKRVKTSEAFSEWATVLCETNTSPTLISQVQRGLNEAGFDAGVADGILGGRTLRAIKQYQASKGLATGGLTLETLKDLGINY